MWTLFVLFHSVAGSCDPGEICLNKCCQEGQVFLGTACGPSNITLDPPLVYRTDGSPPTTRLRFLHRPLDCPRLYYLDPSSVPEEEFRIFEPGKLLFLDGTVRYNFCLESIGGSVEAFAFVCLEDAEKTTNLGFIFYPIGFSLSTACLMILLVVYSRSEERNKVYDFFLMNHAFSLCIGFIVLFLIQVFSPFPYGPCAFLGYAIQFFFMATFFWLNVMCFDIYWAFSGLRNLTGSVKERERKKLILYSIYAWCTPLLILIITVAVDLSPSVPANSIFKPQVGVDKCFFREKTATWIYFYLPMALIILSNIFLFTVTAYRIWSHRKEAAVLKRGDSRKHDSTNDKERFSLYLKLFIVMGINWVMELLSSIVGGPGYLWYIPDFTNTLQGVFIFIIFVWKKRVRRLVRAKIYACFGKKKITSDARNGSSTRNTNSTDSSRTNNSIKMTPTTQSFETTVP